jgi:hypothetical protein
MNLARLFLPIVLAFTLLFSQQAGVLHTLSHAFEQAQQQDKQTPHSSAACEQCAHYAQLDNTLNTPQHQLSLLANAAQTLAKHFFSIPPLAVLTASARAPPEFQ